MLEGVVVPGGGGALDGRDAGRGALDGHRTATGPDRAAGTGPRRAPDRGGHRTAAGTGARRRVAKPDC